MVEHYFSPRTGSEARTRPLRVRLDGAERDLVTAPGIFSPKGLDKGTAVLLEEVPVPEGAFLLDVGCGWGPLALTMGLQNPGARVTAVDVNEHSLQLTARNAAALGLERVETSLPQEVDPSLRFDTIWSNPPIRVGKDALHELLLLWLPRLVPGGRAYLVVQKNLGADSLSAWLARSLGDGFRVSRHATSKGFRVLLVHREA